jgi:hypothetical protein
VARTAAGTKLTTWHVKQQLGVRAATIRDLIKLFPMWNPREPESFERLVEAVYLLAQARGANSATLAARYFEMFKAVDANLTITKALQLAEPASKEMIRAVLRATAVPGYWIKIGLGGTEQAASANALVRLSGGLGRVVLNQGRDTLLGAVASDKHYAGRWMRVSDGDPCPFCAMLLSRGPDYITETTASFEAHDHCACGAEPYDGGPWPEKNTQLHEQWQAMKAQGGGSTLENWRQFYGDTSGAITEEGG